VIFLTLAESLAEESSEAAWRSAVSRAYYAAFHVVWDFFATLRFAVPKADRAHAYLCLRLSNSGRSELVRAGQILQDLRGRRNIADYDRQRRVARPHADKAIADAREILSTIDTDLEAGVVKELTDAIKAYERDVLKEVTWQG
jgi:uncharacterized protein (UPF0332 family)